MDALNEMLNQMSPEEKMMLMADLENLEKSGRELDEMKENAYTYQHPDYTKEVKPLADYLQQLLRMC